MRAYARGARARARVYVYARDATPIRHVIATSVYASLILINFDVLRYTAVRSRRD